MLSHKYIISLYETLIIKHLMLNINSKNDTAQTNFCQRKIGSGLVQLLLLQHVYFIYLMCVHIGTLA